MHSPASSASSDTNSAVSSSSSTKPNHVDMLRYIFPFYSESTLKLTLDESSDNILQAVLQISQDLLSFRAPFIENDNINRVQRMAALFSPSIKKTSNGQPDCCESTYCPSQMAYSWAMKNKNRSHHTPNLVEPMGIVHTECHCGNFSPKVVPEKFPQFNDVSRRMERRYWWLCLEMLRSF